MLVNEALERLRATTGTLSDISGKSVNNLFTNKFILRELMTQLNHYANITKAIEDTYSTTLDTNTPFITAPTLALRSESFKFLLFINQGRIYPVDMRAFANVYSAYPVKNIQGITNWILPWGYKDSTYLYVFPLNSTTPNSTTLNGVISSTDTTITVASTTGFVELDGIIKIGTEKIKYTLKSATQFTGCIRGWEKTTAAIHANSDPVYECNLIMFYSRLHSPITIIDDSFVPQTVLDTELEIAEEHIEGVIKATTYNLLLKISEERATAFKVDADILYQQYKEDIRRGRARIRQGTQIRDAAWFESNIPYNTNLQY